MERMKGSVGYGFLEIECLKETGRWFGKVSSTLVLWLKLNLDKGFYERVFKERTSNFIEKGSFSEGIDSCLGRIDSHDSGLKENVILGLQSRFSHCPNRFRFPQRAR
ncbi:hypothetical protein PIB30_083726, partial [Stylosanthes scabra]|nr:hypothetical protein [Stylosanthes scabra]